MNGHVRVVGSVQKPCSLFPFVYVLKMSIHVYQYQYK